MIPDFDNNERNEQNKKNDRNERNENKTDISLYPDPPDFTNDIFKLPIEYQSKIKTIDQNIVSDLELKGNIETDISSLYVYVYKPQTYFGNKLLEKHAKYYSYDKKFLTDTKKLIKQFKNNVTFENILEPFADSVTDNNSDNYEQIYNLFSEIKNNTDFIDKYQYLNFSLLKRFNNYEQVLLYLSLYNLSSPVFSLITPIISLILPFLIIKFQGFEITFDLYYKYLKHTLGKHALGQVLNNFKGASNEQKVYIIISLIFYFFQVYQNIISCHKFHKNMRKIHDYLFKFRAYISHSIDSMNNFYKYSVNFNTYKEFNNVLIEKKQILEDYNKELHKITDYKISLHKLTKIGHLMKCFYQLYDNNNIKESIAYSFGFNGYIDNLSGLKSNIKNKFINICKYNDKKCEFKDAFFPALMHSNPVKNSYKLDKHIIITGPNAAGKTTLLKTTLFNIILTQQIGHGFYSKCNIKLYNYIHCYINIPDTSGRDSLFQAEARRCKEILDKISKSNKTNHFCVFDELYSGTNPYEAIGSAYSFLNYLNTFNNNNFILTTHYIDLCKRLDKNDCINNYHMKINTDNPDNPDNIEKFEYTYKLVSGISDIKGATKVMKDLDYPKNIVNTMEDVIKTLKL